MRDIITAFCIIHVILAHTATEQHTNTRPTESKLDPSQINHAELIDDNLPDNAAEPIVTHSGPAQNIHKDSIAESGNSKSSTMHIDNEKRPDNHEQQNTDTKAEAKQHVVKDNRTENDAKSNSDKEPENQDSKDSHGQQVADDMKHDDKKPLDLTNKDHPTADDHQQNHVDVPKPVDKPNIAPAPPVPDNIGKSKSDNQAVKQEQKVEKVAEAVPAVDDDDGSSPTVVWFVLFSVVIIVSVAVYLHRSGLRAPSALGFEPVPRHSSSHAEEVPLMSPVDQIVSTALVNLRVPASAIDKYIRAFHAQRITRIDQLDDSTWKKLALPSAIELELRRRFEEASIKPRSAGLALHRDDGSRSAQDFDDMEFDDWSFDDEEGKDSNI